MRCDFSIQQNRGVRYTHSRVLNQTDSEAALEQFINLHLAQVSTCARCKLMDLFTFMPTLRQHGAADSQAPLGSSRVLTCPKLTFIVHSTVITGFTEYGLVLNTSDCYR
jgi:hypothetical protein